VRKRQIPHYKNGKKLYFYEDELLDWIAQGKRKTIQEIDEIAHKTEKRFK
jgi:excisionase